MSNKIISINSKSQIGNIMKNGKKYSSQNANYFLCTENKIMNPSNAILNSYDENGNYIGNTYTNSNKININLKKVKYKIYYCIIIGKGIGKAHDRNYIRRRLRSSLQYIYTVVDLYLVINLKSKYKDKSIVENIINDLHKFMN